MNLTRLTSMLLFTLCFVHPWEQRALLPEHGGTDGKLISIAPAKISIANVIDTLAIAMTGDHIKSQCFTLATPTSI